MDLSNQQKKQFRAIGHKLKPVVTVAGNGLSENVVKELERAINDHELIKVKLNVGTRKDKATVLTQINQRLGTATVQEVGNIALIYRPSAKPDPQLSNLRRTNIFTN
jgi:RNA-binding protein